MARRNNISLTDASFQYFSPGASKHLNFGVNTTTQIK